MHLVPTASAGRSCSRARDMLEGGRAGAVAVAVAVVTFRLVGRRRLTFLAPYDFTTPKPCRHHRLAIAPHPLSAAAFASSSSCVYISAVALGPMESLFA
jgi:hypothetical protein